MDPWFDSLAAGDHLPTEVLRCLLDEGFVVIPGLAADAEQAKVADAYDRAVLEADASDRATGRFTTRVHDLVNRGPEFDELYLHPAVLEACCRVIGQPFKLSSMLARTLHARSEEQQLHVDFPADRAGWPMVGFILMVDEFRQENGATRFVAGSQGFAAPAGLVQQACGRAGSVIVYNGSVWHGHGANHTDCPRRSIQGAFIRRTEKSGVDLPARMRPETLGRISALARYLLAL